MVEETDLKKKIKDIILELEHASQLFRPDEVAEKAKLQGIPEEDALKMLDELKADNYIHEVSGTDGLLARTVWRDYSPAFEEIPQF